MHSQACEPSPLARKPSLLEHPSAPFSRRRVELNPAKRRSLPTEPSGPAARTSRSSTSTRRERVSRNYRARQLTRPSHRFVPMEVPARASESHRRAPVPRRSRRGPSGTLRRSPTYQSSLSIARRRPLPNQTCPHRQYLGASARRRRRPAPPPEHRSVPHMRTNQRYSTRTRPAEACHRRRPVPSLAPAHGPQQPYRDSTRPDQTRTPPPTPSQNRAASRGPVIVTARQQKLRGSKNIQRTDGSHVDK